MNCGSLLHDRDFQFSNSGGTSPKLSIIVCERGDCHFALIVTSKGLGKGTTQGAQLSDKPPNYFLPAGSSWFDEDTWILLDELHELSNYVLDEKLGCGSAEELRNKLAPELLLDIFKSAMQSRLLDGWDKEFIQSAINELSKSI